MIVVDANIAIAVLNPADRFHHQAVTRCVTEGGVAILNLTRAEALIHPTRAGVAEQASVALDALGFATHPVGDEVADRARHLRAEYGNRNFPMVDAIVVGFAQLQGVAAVTADSKWPAIEDVVVEVLG